MTKQREMRGRVPTMAIHTNELPEWLILFGDIIGAEGEGEDTPPAGSEGEPNGSGDDPEGDDPDDHEDDAGKDLPEDHPLKLAIKKERQARKAAEREAAKLAKEKSKRDREAEDAKLAEQGELAQEKAKRERAEAQAQKLATGYRKSAVDRAIERAAGELKFIDVDDALSGVDREGITVEQDDEDPSVVKVDTKTVKAAVKALADRKKHLIRSGTEDGAPTGSQFGAGGQRKGKATDDDRMKEIYPSLR